MSDEDARAAALSAIAAAVTGRERRVEVVDDPAGITNVTVDPLLPPLRYVEVPDLESPGAWVFDEAPTGPANATHRWRGHLVVVDRSTPPTAVELGDRAALAAAWPTLVHRLAPVQLAGLIARYFGFDAGLPVHHTVIDDPAAFVAELVADEAPIPGVASPSLDPAGRLEFWTSFIETGRGSAPKLGATCWQATWADDQALAWSADVVRRGLRGRLFEPGTGLP